jgi:hypothetical protein
MASTGVVTNNRSMNGIITYDDGQGGVLENGQLTAQHSDLDTSVVDNITVSTNLTLQGTITTNTNVITNTWVSYLYGLTGNIQGQINSILVNVLGSNNIWTGTNTFNNTVAINSNLSVSGSITGPTITTLNTNIAAKQDTITSSNRLGADLIGTGIVSTAEYNYLDGVTSSIQNQINSKQSTVTSSNRLSADLIGTGIVSTAEYNYLDGVTSSIQPQLDSKQATVTSSNRLGADLIGTGIVSTAEYNYLDGVTSSIQNQINSKQDSVSSSNRLNADLVGTGVVSNAEYNYLDGVTSPIQTQLDSKAPINNPTFTGTLNCSAITCTDIDATGHVYATDGGFSTLSSTSTTTLGYPIYWGSQTEKLTGPTTKIYTTNIPNVILCQGSGTINITMPKNSHTQLIILDNVNVSVSKQTTDLNFSSFVNVANVSTSSSPKTFSSTALVNLYYVTNGLSTYIYWAKPTLNTTP